MAASIRNRLERGERCWPADLALRGAGLGLLTLFMLAWRTVCRLADQPPPHGVAPSTFAIAAVAYACLSIGLALVLDGAGLFRLLPMPPRALLS